MPEKLTGRGISIELGPLENNFIAKIAVNKGVDSLAIVQDIVIRSKGNPGAATVLAQLYEKIGETKYIELSSKLDSGASIWEIYKDKCHEDLDCFIKHYNSKVI